MIRPPPPTFDERTTLESVSDPSLRHEAAGVTATVLWHSDLSRIGQTAWLDNAVAAAQGLSRAHPVFTDARPLEHQGVSRSPLLIDARPDKVRLVCGKASQRFSVDGVAQAVMASVAPEDFARGIVVGLGKVGPLLLVRPGRLADASGLFGMVGASPAIARVRAEVARAAKRPFPVLIRGATGTGKELVAAALHHASGRSGRYIAINVAALPPSTATSQLFGHARGAFTGADRVSGGYFGDAEGGTLLLDEIGTASMALQAQLLRALESGEVQPVGGRPRKVDVRIVAATDEDLERAIATGRFRSPLLHRLAHAPIVLEPLRVRPADIPVQFVHFAQATAREMYGVELPDGWLRREDVYALLQHTWPGNSRELRALAQRCAADQGTVPVATLPPLSTGTPAEATIDEDPLLAALEAHDWKLRPTAAALGIGRNTLKRRMADQGLRRVSDLDAGELRQALATYGSVQAAAGALRVSQRGLQLRLGELGLS